MSHLSSHHVERAKSNYICAGLWIGFDFLGYYLRFVWADNASIEFEMGQTEMETREQ